MSGDSGGGAERSNRSDSDDIPSFEGQILFKGDFDSSDSDE